MPCFVPMWGYKSKTLKTLEEIRDAIKENTKELKAMSESLNQALDDLESAIADEMQQLRNALMQAGAGQAALDAVEATEARVRAMTSNLRSDDNPEPASNE